MVTPISLTSEVQSKIQNYHENVPLYDTLIKLCNEHILQAAANGDLIKVQQSAKLSIALIGYFMSNKELTPRLVEQLIIETHSLVPLAC